MPNKSTSAFTLIELMIAAAVIAILAMIAIPKFSDLIVKAKEAVVRGKVGSIRSSIGIYFADMEGDVYPMLPIMTSTSTPLVPNYLDNWPFISIPTYPTHVPSDRSTGWNVVEWSNAARICYGYDRTTGRFRVACTHTDSRGDAWSQF